MKNALIVFLLLAGCDVSDVDAVGTHAELKETTTCESIVRAWCEYHIECGTVNNNITECTHMMSWLYCSDDIELENSEYGAMCFHDLKTSECNEYENSWPGSCYYVLGIEESC